MGNPRRIDASLVFPLHPACLYFVRGRLVHQLLRRFLQQVPHQHGPLHCFASKEKKSPFPTNYSSLVPLEPLVPEAPLLGRRQMPVEPLQPGRAALEVERPGHGALFRFTHSSSTVQSGGIELTGSLFVICRTCMPSFHSPESSELVTKLPRLTWIPVASSRSSEVPRPKAAGKAVSKTDL